MRTLASSNHILSYLQSSSSLLAQPENESVKIQIQDVTEYLPLKTNKQIAKNEWDTRMFGKILHLKHFSDLLRTVKTFTRHQVSCVYKLFVI